MQDLQWFEVIPIWMLVWFDVIEWVEDDLGSLFVERDRQCSTSVRKEIHKDDEFESKEENFHPKTRNFSSPSKYNQDEEHYTKSMLTVVPTLSEVVVHHCSLFLTRGEEKSRVTEVNFDRFFHLDPTGNDREEKTKTDSCREANVLNIVHANGLYRIAVLSEDYHYSYIMWFILVIEAAHRQDVCHGHINRESWYTSTAAFSFLCMYLFGWLRILRWLCMMCAREDLFIHVVVDYTRTVSILLYIKNDLSSISRSRSVPVDLIVLTATSAAVFKDCLFPSPRMMMKT